MLKSGYIAVAGKVEGVEYDSKTKSYEVKRGTSKNGTKYQSFRISVYSKNADGSYENGKGIDVLLFGDKPIKVKDVVGILGRLKPNNYVKDGVEIKGHSIIANLEDMFEPIPYESKESAVEDKPSTSKRPSVEDIW